MAPESVCTTDHLRALFWQHTAQVQLGCVQKATFITGIMMVNNLGTEFLHLGSIFHPGHSADQFLVQGAQVGVAVWQSLLVIMVNTNTGTSVVQW